MLAYLVLLYDPEPPPFIGIEEPENFLHPRLLPELAEECRKTCERTQLLVTTHSPFFLDARGKGTCPLARRRGPHTDQASLTCPACKTWTKVRYSVQFGVGDPLVEHGAPTRDPDSRMTARRRCRRAFNGARALLPRLLPPDRELRVFQGKRDLREAESRLRAYATWLPDDHRIVVMVDRTRRNVAPSRNNSRRLPTAQAAYALARGRAPVAAGQASDRGGEAGCAGAYPRVSAPCVSDAIPGGTWEAFERILKPRIFHDRVAQGGSSAPSPLTIGPQSRRASAYSSTRVERTRASPSALIHMPPRSQG